MWKRLLILIALLLPLAGCGPFNPVDPLINIGIMWFEGEAVKYYNTDEATLERALKGALKELDLAVTKEERKGDTFYVTAGDKARFHIKLTTVRFTTTKLSIRVNVMGDKPYAEMVYRHVDAQPGVKQYVTAEHLWRDLP